MYPDKVEVVSRGDIVTLNSVYFLGGELEYYGIAIYEKELHGEAYVRVFKQDGSIDRYTSRYSKRDIGYKISKERAREIIVKSAIKVIDSNLEKL